VTPSDQSYREIPLTQGYTALVDSSDFDVLMKWKWYAWYSPSGKSWYAVRSVKTEHGGRSLRMHREILGLASGDRRQVDHRNHDTLDNRRSNIRVCTPSQNTQNRRTQSNSKSGHKGVSFRPSKRKWRATIFVDGKHLHLGYRETKEECIQLYQEAARKFFGEFAWVSA